MMNKITKRLLAATFSATLLLSGCAGQPDATSAQTPLDITVWTYYNGDQLTSFNEIVEEFNATVGKEKGIAVSGASQGTVNDLATNVLAAAKGEVGAEEIPNIFSAYSDTAYALDQLGCVADLSPYMTEEDLSHYVDSYVDEGRFSGDGIKIFPVAKSVELMTVNKTDWDKFAAVSGATYEDIATMEGLTATAEAYYNWTDSLTAAADDGKALFGRDAMANYFLAGSMQMGTEIFAVKDGKATLHFDRETIQKLWDNYYTPFVKGYFAASGRFRSDDLKTNNIIVCVGSSSGATFLPDRVAVNDTEEYPIELEMLPCPQFKGAERVAIQQGAGMVVTTGTDEEVAACVEFLKWFTASERNIAFSVASGYLPVMKDANNMSAIEGSGLEISQLMGKVLKVSVDTISENRLYTPLAFAGGADARGILEHTMSDLATADRATVKERLEAGMGLDEACAEFLSPQYFEAWYSDALSSLQALAAG